VEVLILVDILSSYQGHVDVVVLVVAVGPLVVLGSYYHLSTSKALVELWVIPIIAYHLAIAIVHAIGVVVDLHDITLVP
jgi:hypothetical protein